MNGPQVAGQPAADRLMEAVDRRLHFAAERPTREQVAAVVRGLADHTALEAARVYSREPGMPWPTSTSIGRWLHAVGDQLVDMRESGPAPR